LYLGAPRGGRRGERARGVRATVVYVPRHASGRAIARKFPTIMTYSAARGRRPLTLPPRPSLSGGKRTPQITARAPPGPPRVAAVDRSDRE